MSSLGDRDFAPEELRDQFSRGLRASQSELGVTMKVHGVDRQPPGEGKTFVTYTVRVGYALPNDSRNRTRLESGEASSQVIPVEVSMNEPVCADRPFELADDSGALRVSTLEDIVAEKLRAWLQQEKRNRRRPQDLLDIARILKNGAALDLDSVSSFLELKALARGVPVSKEAFKDPELATRAHSEYDERLQGTVTGDFVPFDEALGLLYDLVEKLDIASS